MNISSPEGVAVPAPYNISQINNVDRGCIFTHSLIYVFSWQLVDVFSSVRILQKSSKITKRKSEVVNRRRRDNTIAKIPLWYLQ